MSPETPKSTNSASSEKPQKTLEEHILDEDGNMLTMSYGMPIPKYGEGGLGRPKKRNEADTQVGPPPLYESSALPSESNEVEGLLDQIQRDINVFMSKLPMVPFNVMRESIEEYIVEYLSENGFSQDSGGDRYYTCEYLEEASKICITLFIEGKEYTLDFSR